MSVDELPAGLLDYLTKRQNQRDADVARVWLALTKRERKLVREAAVMANLLGMRRAGQFREPPPADSAVVVEVISACLAQSDLFPTLAKVLRKTIEEPA